MAGRLKQLRLKLVNGCNQALIKELLDALLEEKILTDAEAESIRESNSVTRDKMRDLIDTVHKKGDKASNIMMQKLSEIDTTLSANVGITAPELPLPTQEMKVEPHGQKSPSEHLLLAEKENAGPLNQTDPNGITLCSKKEYDRILSQEGDNIYPLTEPREKRTRLALIICNEKFDHPNLKERHGAKLDVTNMEKLLQGLGYKVLIENNLTVKDMQSKMKEFAARTEHMTSDSTFLVFMSHGQRDVICGTDSQVTLNRNSEEQATNVLHVDEIFTTFNNVNCRVLRDKPKIIIIQACRGGERSQVLVSDSVQSSSVQEAYLEEDAMRMLQKERDFICFCSTTPDTVSWRDPKQGSLFILHLIELMKKDAHHYSIEDLFRNVQLSFKDKVQMPAQERKTLLKKFYLFPGH